MFVIDIIILYFYCTLQGTLVNHRITSVLKFFRHAINSNTSICISHFWFVHNYLQRQPVISYLLQLVASSFVEITASSCDILSLEQFLDHKHKTKHFKQAAMFVAFPNALWVKRVGGMGRRDWVRIFPRDVSLAWGRGRKSPWEAW